jgi:hypothetical protein
VATNSFFLLLTLLALQGGDDEDGEGGGFDIGALLGNLGPLLGGLSGVSVFPLALTSREINFYDGKMSECGVLVWQLTSSSYY